MQSFQAILLLYEIWILLPNSLRQTTCSNKVSTKVCTDNEIEFCAIKKIRVCFLPSISLSLLIARRLHDIANVNCSFWFDWRRQLANTVQHTHIFVFRPRTKPLTKWNISAGIFFFWGSALHCNGESQHLKEGEARHCQQNSTTPKNMGAWAKSFAHIFECEATLRPLWETASRRYPGRSRRRPTLSLENVRHAIYCCFPATGYIR